MWVALEPTSVLSWVTVLSALGAGVLDWRRHRTAPRPGRRPEQRYSLELDDVGLRSRHPLRPDEVVRWSDVVGISAVTTARTARPPHLFLLLHERRGPGATVPLGAPGSRELLERLAAVPGFDLAAVAAAREHDGNDVFPCWRGAGLPLGDGIFPL